ncbi:type II toxin-antitoxin system VapC family toxin [Mycobacterium sp. M1]|uniref:Type II toxin-antitoxin system VapC family toxin n=1 Tax=Mycolicibacter acidiphilus TaxID=2835306 RepID=A0ABS5RGE5_9MYCO|nr:type II toxin-antitoxin system VapC family toxin [Mycolicibacter acidiphilus]MBS9533356.1 type II toxin-antitoxin system VapC family toxin [Mycolicibacter acidiphilus]
MILVDTSVWVDHLRTTDEELSGLLERGLVLAHPWVVGEVALGGLSAGSLVAPLMSRLPGAVVATDTEVLTLIERQHLAGSGIGYVDAQLLAATRLTPDARLWTRDHRLDRAAERVGVAYRPGAGVDA